MIFLRTEATQHGYGQSEVATTLADGIWTALWPTLGLKAGEFPVCLQMLQAPKAGPPGACFKCGMHGHWARECTLQQSHLSQQSQPQWQPVQTQVQALRGRPAGGFSVQGDWTLCTTFSAGRTYDARGPHPYPCVRCRGAAVCTGRSTPAPLPWRSPRPTSRTPSWPRHGAQPLCPPPPPLGKPGAAGRRVGGGASPLAKWLLGWGARLRRRLLLLGAPGPSSTAVGGEHGFCLGAGTQRRRPCNASVGRTLAHRCPCTAFGALGGDGEVLSGLTGHHISGSHGQKAPATTAHRGPHPLGHCGWGWSSVQLRTWPTGVGNLGYALNYGHGCTLRD